MAVWRVVCRRAHTAGGSSVVGSGPGSFTGGISTSGGAHQDPGTDNQQNKGHSNLDRVASDEGGPDSMPG